MRHRVKRLLDDAPARLLAAAAVAFFAALDDGRLGLEDGELGGGGGAAGHDCGGVLVWLTVVLRVLAVGGWLRTAETR
ncbi:hypothetical protein IWX50DRAFT_623060 [Phyllosticta citricarpa]